MVAVQTAPTNGLRLSSHKILFAFESERTEISALNNSEMEICAKTLVSLITIEIQCKRAMS